MNYGSTELADFMTLADDAAEKHKAYSLRAELVRPLLECCRDDECAARAIQGLAKIGRLDLMQEVAQLYAPTAHYDWSYHWQNALEYACERDDMVMIQWLMARPYWRGLQVTVQKSQMHKAFRKAAERGSITAMEYLHSQEFTGVVGPIRNGHVDAVAWLLEHGWQVERRDACDLMCEAAKYGHVDIMQLLQDKLGKQVYDERHGGISSGQFGRRALTVAVEHGHLAVLQWIRANRPELDWKGCSAGAVFLDDLEVLQWLYENRLCQLARCNVAAAHGRLEIVRWILSVEPEHSTSGLLDDAVRSNNMELVQWLHENTDASSTTEAMDFATRYGNLAMLKWLHAHRPDGCTTNAIEYALGLTDTRVASWLVKHFPELLPRKMTLCCQLDMLIFVRVHFPQLLQPEAFRQGTTTISGFNSCNVNAARDWLRENYGDQVSWSISWIDITY